MRIVFIILLICTTARLFAQEGSLDTLNTADTTVNVDQVLYQYGIYLEPLIEVTPGPDGPYACDQIGFGLSYRRVSGGVFLSTFKGHYEKTLVFPNKFELEYMFGGGYLGMQVLRINQFEVDLRLNYGHGDMIWERTDSRADFSRDEFDLIKPEIQISGVPFRYLKLFITSGYRKIYNLSLTGTDSGEFSGFTAGFGLKAGYFK